MTLSKKLFGTTTGEGVALDTEGAASQKPKFSFFFDGLASGIIVVLTFLLPLMVAISPAVGDEVVKRTLFSVAILLAFLFWLLARLEDGVFRIPRNSILTSTLVVGLVSLAATLFSPILRDSLMGAGTEGGTFVAIILSLITLFLVSSYAQSTRVLTRIYGALGLAALVLLVTQVLHVAFGLSFGVLAGATENLLGKWNDLGLFFGLMLLLSLVGTELFHLPRRFRAILMTCMVLSGIVLFFVNFAFAWLLVAVLALITLVYKHVLGLRAGTQTSYVPGRSILRTSSFVVIVVAVLAIFANSLISQQVQNRLQLGALEVRPSWASTYDITKATLGSHPVLGSGLNRFARQWQLHKPVGVNDTIFWSADFNTGVGLIPTFAVTSGLLGMIAWLFFLCSFLYLGLRSLFLAQSDRLHQSLRYLAFAGALYLWLTAFFYVPDTVLWTLAFLFMGLFVASHASAQPNGGETVERVRDPRLNFAFILLLVVLVLVDIAGGYYIARRYQSLIVYQKALYGYSLTGNITEAEQGVTRAISIDGSQDTFYRSLVDIHLLKLNQLLAQATEATSKETLRAQFQSVLSEAINTGNKATVVNGKRTPPILSDNYLNWLALGRVYEAVVPLQIEGAYALAQAAYAKAGAVNPSSPQIYMSYARLEIAKNDRKKARSYIAEALKMKSNYTEALFVLSQLDYGDGNIKSAIKNAEQVAVLAPQDIGVFFQLGFLHYLDRDYKSAILALERARALNPNYSNAKYFLGLSYSMSGQRSLAIKEFEEIAALNPDNAEVKTILSNLRNGNAALAGIGAPANTPEKRPTLPVKEDPKAATKASATP